MKSKKKTLLIWAVVAGIFYFFMSYHIIVIESSIKLLKKSRFTLEYTFFNAKGKTNAKILSIEDLRYDGIGDIMVEKGLLSQDQLEMFITQIEEKEED